MLWEQKVPNNPGKRKLMQFHMSENVEAALRFIAAQDVCTLI